MGKNINKGIQGMQGIQSIQAYLADDSSDICSNGRAHSKAGELYHCAKISGTIVPTKTNKDKKRYAYNVSKHF